MASTHKSKIRGSEHLIAMVEAQSGGGKIAVDLGPAKKLETEIQKGAQLSFTGMPVKVKDTRILIAETLQQDGETIQISRPKEESKKS